MDDYTSYDAIDLAALVRRRAVTPSELLQAAGRQRDTPHGPPPRSLRDLNR